MRVRSGLATRQPCARVDSGGCTSADVLKRERAAHALGNEELFRQFAGFFSYTWLHNVLI